MLQRNSEQQPHFPSPLEKGGPVRERLCRGAETRLEAIFVYLSQAGLSDADIVSDLSEMVPVIVMRRRREATHAGKAVR